MGGEYPTDVDLFVFRTHPRFIVSYGGKVEPHDQLTELKNQWGAQAETVRHFKIDPWDLNKGGLSSFSGFIYGSSIYHQPVKHNDLFPEVCSGDYCFSLPPHRLVPASNRDPPRSDATLYAPIDLKGCVPFLHDDCINLRTDDTASRENIETVVEWVRVCALTQRWLGVLTLTFSC